MNGWIVWDPDRVRSFIDIPKYECKLEWLDCINCVTWKEENLPREPLCNCPPQISHWITCLSFQSLFLNLWLVQWCTHSNQNCGEKLNIKRQTWYDMLLLTESMIFQVTVSQNMKVVKTKRTGLVRWEKRVEGDFKHNLYYIFETISIAFGYKQLMFLNREELLLSESSFVKLFFFKKNSVNRFSLESKYFE